MRNFIKDMNLGGDFIIAGFANARQREVFDNNNDVQKTMINLNFIDENNVEIQTPIISQIGIYDVYFKATVRKGNVAPNYRNWYDPAVTINLTSGIGYTFISNKIQINIV